MCLSLKNSEIYIFEILTKTLNWWESQTTNQPTFKKMLIYLIWLDGTNPYHTYKANAMSPTNTSFTVLIEDFNGKRVCGIL